MEDMILYMFFVVPATQWITNPDRPWNRVSQKYGLMMAVFCLFVIGLLQSSRESNHFETLGVEPNAPPRVVASAYRKLSLLYHPDKDPSVEAAAVFEKIRGANEILASEKRRDAYCRFGDYSKEGEIGEEYFYEILLYAFLQYVIPLIFGFLYTYGDNSTLSRVLFVWYISFSFAMEMLLRFDTSSFGILSFVPFFGSFLPFEKARFFQGWVPVVLNGLLLLVSDNFPEADELLDTVSRHLLEANLDTIPRLDKLLVALEDVIEKCNRSPKVTVWTFKGKPEDEENARKVYDDIQVSGQLDTKTGMKRLVEVGFVEESKSTKTWRLNTSDQSQPDIWAAVIRKEISTWPEGLSIANCALREECAINNWSNRQQEYKKLLDDDEEEKAGSGISVGSIIFFLMLFLRWYNAL